MTARQVLFNLRLFIYRHCLVKRRRIVFLSHLGKAYACNPRYLCEYLAGHYGDEYELIWVYDKSTPLPAALPQNVKAVPYFSHKCLFLISTAGFIISNTRISDDFYFIKRKKQKYIQLWHSTIRLKCIEKDANLGSNYRDFAIKDSARISVIMSGSSFSTNIFKRSFWYNGEILETGTPRIDWLLNLTNKDIHNIYKKTKLSNVVHYVLYAPTFRKDGSLAPYDINFAQLCDTLKHKFGGDWVALFRLHPNLKGRIAFNCDRDVIDMTDYDDIQELLAISDILITDYSSSMFDAAFCEKICVLYASDYYEYIANERKLYFTVEELPFPIAHNNTQLNCIIDNFDVCVYKKQVSSFLNTIGSVENGDACKNITRYIISHT